MIYIQNPLLETIKTNWPGTPVDENNRFVNAEFPFVPRTREVFKWMFSKNPQKEEKKQDTFRLTHADDTSFLADKNDCIVWLGHATFFIRLNGIQLLIDPVFYEVPFVKRYADHAFGPAFFHRLNYLLISHDHQDHCQEKSIRNVVAQNPDVRILTGLNMESLLRPWSKNVPIQMAGWYQQYDTDLSIEICYLPSRHWSKRGLNDANKRLWGAFMIKAKDKTIYFSGDTGYGNHFKEAQTLFPTINVAIIGIGAYKPEWFMHPNHASPGDAVKAFNEIGAQQLIPMHYGTFNISDEPVGEPLRILKSLESQGKITGTLKILDLGESYGSF